MLMPSAETICAVVDAGADDHAERVRLSHSQSTSPITTPSPSTTSRAK